MPFLIQLPLDMPEVEVLSTAFRPDGALLIQVESTRQGTHCGRCSREIHHFHGCEHIRCTRIPEAVIVSLIDIQTLY